MFTKQNRIDELAVEKKKLMQKKEKITNKMKETNSKRETKMDILQNKCVEDRNAVLKKCQEIDRRIDKIMRDIDSEQIYTNEVANSEKDQYYEERKDEIHLQEKTKKGK